MCVRGIRRGVTISIMSLEAETKDSSGGEGE